MTISPVVNQVASGRRLVARQLVMNGLGTIPCQVWRKRVVPNDPATPTATGLSWNSIALSEQDEPDYEYDELGYAYMLLDRFTGAAMHDNNSMVNGADTMIMAQIEPYDDSITDKRQQIIQLPEWLPKIGDLFALLIQPELILLHNCFYISTIGPIFGLSSVITALPQDSPTPKALKSRVFFWPLSESASSDTMVRGRDAELRFPYLSNDTGILSMGILSFLPKCFMMKRLA